LSSILSNIHEPTKDSSSLLNVAVSEIGRRSASISWGGWALGAGITLASFHRAGTMPSRIEALKIAHTGPESWEQKSRRIQLGKPSGPGALWILIRLNFLSTADNRVVLRGLLLYSMQFGLFYIRPLPVADCLPWTVFGGFLMIRGFLILVFLQCLYTVRWMTGRACSLKMSHQQSTTVVLCANFWTVILSSVSWSDIRQKYAD